MTIFRRRARPPRSPDRDGGAEEPPMGAREAQEPWGAHDGAGPLTGRYLTDGRSLFRVQHAITEAEGLHLDEAILELEDCMTLELILCSASALERLGLRPVTPSSPMGRRALRA